MEQLGQQQYAIYKEYGSTLVRRPERLTVPTLLSTGKDLRSAVSQPAHHSYIGGEDLLQPNVIADQTTDLCNSKDHRQCCIAQVQVLETCKGCPASKAPLHTKEIIML